jgi:hypothetical protein
MFLQRNRLLLLVVICIFFVSCRKNRDSDVVSDFQILGENFKWGDTIWIENLSINASEFELYSDVYWLGEYHISDNIGWILTMPYYYSDNYELYDSLKITLKASEGDQNSYRDVTIAMDLNELKINSVKVLGWDYNKYEDDLSNNFLSWDDYADTSRLVFETHSK